MLTVILAIVLLGSLAGIAVLIGRKFPELVLLDLGSIAREREKKVKYDLIRDRVERSGRELAGSVRRGLRPLGRFMLLRIRALYDRVLELERKYRDRAHPKEKRSKIQTLMQEARALEQNGEYLEAERRLVAAIALNPKYAKAYEEIGRLAMKNKKFDEAEQAFRHVLKLDPGDASAHANWGELEEARGNVRAAVLHYADAVSRKPGNPKYLSFLLESALAAGNRTLARETFARLKEVNPENQKLPELEQKIRGT